MSVTALELCQPRPRSEFPSSTVEVSVAMRCGACVCLLLFTWGVSWGSTGLVLRLGEPTEDTDRGASFSGVLTIPFVFNGKVDNLPGTSDTREDHRTSSGIFFNRPVEVKESTTHTNPYITSHKNIYDEEEKLIPKQNISSESKNQIVSTTGAPSEQAKKVPVSVNGDDGRSVVDAPSTDCEVGSKRDWTGLCRPIYTS